MNENKRGRIEPSRRDFLRGTGLGLASLAFGSLLDPRLLQAADAISKAKRCIFLFMFGGPSQMDLFDYKPVLNKRSGEAIDHERRRRQVRTSVLLGTQRKFRQYGETGQWCSDALPRLSRHMDKLAVVKSLYVDSFAHGSAVLQMNSGKVFQGHPALGAWMSYGLGSENEDLPRFVVMHDPRGGPISGAENWSSGYMPASHQGTLFRAQGNPVLDLRPAAEAGGGSGITGTIERDRIDVINSLNQGHLQSHPGYSELEARMETYELAWRMKSSAPAALDVESEPRKTQEMYGMFDPKPDHRLAVGSEVFGRQCLIARRLIERGVRFVQIYHGGGHQQQTWDAHHGVEENLSIHCPEVDRPIDGLLTDLEQRGLLDETLVVWGGEFGRQPVSQQAGNDQLDNPKGRDHNPKGFSMWLAGAGVKPGSYGATDELGFEAVENRRHVRDFHATILHLMGIDHEALSYYYGGLDRRLTGPEEAHVISEILA